VSAPRPKNPTGISHLTPEQRSLRARIAAHARWSKPGARQRQAVAASAAQLRRHEFLVDPAGDMDPVERRQAAESSIKAEMAKLSFQAAKARRS
jgi:hypothetical protein